MTVTEPSNTRALLDELRIDRRPRPRRRSRSAVIGLTLLVAIGALAVWWRGDEGNVASQPAPAAIPPVTETNPSTPISPGTSAPAEILSAGSSVLDATGYVVARRKATVSAEVTGQVTEVFIEEGQTVAAGELLARLDDAAPRAQLDLAQAQLDAAVSSAKEIALQHAQAERDLVRTTRLAERGLASPAAVERDRLALDALEAREDVARQQVTVQKRALAVQARALEEREVRAPFAGVVVAKAAQPGEIISPISAGGGFTRTGICTIVDMSSLEVEVDVNEAYINRVYGEQPVEVRLNAYPDAPYEAAVIAIIPSADRNKATVRVRIRLLAPDARVLPDMGVRVAFLEAPGAA
ncbi:MAG: efflux RND transporter periplasmic adaptor subunit [Pseudomonadales bacterium]